MKVAIEDKRALRSIGLADLFGYLRAKDWERAKDVGAFGALWILSQDEKSGGAELLLPTTTKVSDYATRMFEALNVLERVEERSQQDIFRDICAAGADQIRARRFSPDTAQGSIALDDGVSLVQGARNLVYAAARAAVQPKPYFTSRGGAEVQDYLNSVRLGQTEHGSYTISIISPVPPALTEPSRGMLFEKSEPFGRKVTATLARALFEAHQAAISSASTGNMEPFAQAVPHGVSGNLCDAIVKMGGGETQSRQFEVSIAWSPARPLLDLVPSSIRFEPDTIPVIQQAREFFGRETDEIADFEVLGPVLRLKRPQDELEKDGQGEASIYGLVDGRSRFVVVPITGENLHTAVIAFEQRKNVRCVGTLQREGRTHSMDNLTTFCLTDEA